MSTAGRLPCIARSSDRERLGRRNNTDWRVDIELPTGGSTGNCHVQGKKGAYDKTKKYMSSAADMAQLPGSVANNAELIAGVVKGLAILAELRKNK